MQGADGDNGGGGDDEGDDEDDADDADEDAATDLLSAQLQAGLAGLHGSGDSDDDDEEPEPDPDETDELRPQLFCMFQLSWSYCSKSEFLNLSNNPGISESALLCMQEIA